MDRDAGTTTHGLQDDRARLDWLRQAYFGLDGRWYLKLRERTDATTAQQVDEDVTNSLGRLHVRVWQSLTGATSIPDCQVLGRFVRDVFDILYGDHREAVRVIHDTPDRFELQHVSCAIFDMGVAAGYEDDPVPGQLPGCGGIAALVRGWVEQAGDFGVRQLPAVDENGGVACRYVFETTGVH